ncbi:hypothetical protein VTN02DRAFT_1202 [Thermoascus thermophilus]
MPPPSSSSSSSSCTAAADPTNHLLFDPWTSAATGHQRADGPSVAGTRWWRDVRTEKLGRQFRGDYQNQQNRQQQQHLHGRKRERGNKDIRCFMGGVAKQKQNRNKKLEEDDHSTPCSASASASAVDDTPGAFSLDSTKYAIGKDDTAPAPETPPETETGPGPRRRGIFSNLTFYINGSTYPLISDHRLRHLLVTNGAEIALAPARRTVTHVILGTHNRTTTIGVREGCGGGLAARKLQREIERVGGGGGGSGVRFVGVEWVLESIKAAKRLPEARFAHRTLHVAPRGQPSVLRMFGNLEQRKQKKEEEEESKVDGE